MRIQRQQEGPPSGKEASSGQQEEDKMQAEVEALTKQLQKKRCTSNGRTWTRRRNFMAHMSRLHQNLGMIRQPPGPSKMKR